jgi:hypothetical protein
MRKDWLVAPAGIVRLAGVLAEVSVSLRVTTRPPAGAGLEMFTLPVTLLQPATVVRVSSRPGFARGADNSAMYATGKLLELPEVRAHQSILAVHPTL